MGWPAAAAAFREEQGIPFPLLVDQERKTYRALDIKRASLFNVAGPHLWGRAVGNILSGKRQSRPRQDALQLGGAVVVAPGGRLIYEHRAVTSADNAPTSELLAAVDRAVTAD